MPALGVLEAPPDLRQLIKRDFNCEYGIFEYEYHQTMLHSFINRSTLLQHGEKSCDSPPATRFPYNAT